MNNPRDAVPNPLSRDVLIGVIQAAFDGVCLDGGTTLHEAEELDCHGSPDDLIAARRLDTDTRWQDVPEAWIEQYSSALSFLDMKGLRYYLPAVMIWALKHDGRTQSASDDVLESLLVSKAEALLPLLTGQQKNATAQWLYRFASNRVYEPQKAVAVFMATPWAACL